MNAPTAPNSVRVLRARLAASSAVLALLLAGGIAAAAPAAAAGVDWVADPAEHVDTLNGTGIGGDVVGSINNFPGPAVPFGMVQFSPDTTSTYAGYQYHNDRMTGFSMNHASAGCNVFGDIPILPATGDLGGEPWAATQRYTHDDEVGEAGYYAVSFPDSGIRTELTATDRVGLSRITYPEGAPAQFMVRPGGSLAGNSAADLQVVDARTVVGSATTGNFCGKGNTYRIYFELTFDQDFTAHGTWDGQSVSADSDSVSSSHAGAYFTFPEGITLQAKVAVSYVSVDGAAANGQAEVPDWDFDGIRSAAAQRWNDALSRVRISQAPDEDVETFYTSLYRSLLHPNVFNDADGRYIGFDNEIHQIDDGRAHYANFSDWDTYRTLVPLQTMLFPDIASDMAQSLVVDAQQSGSLPRWPVANAATGQMTGDSVSAVIAQIRAFGGTDFDAESALAFMVAAADDGGEGLNGYLQRKGAATYEERGYAPQVEEFRGDHQVVGASITLEWSVDDFAIGRLAADLGKTDIAERFQQRSSNWQNLFDPAQTAIAARNDDGTFLNASDLGSGFGQPGFDEGNAEQYLWMIPQNIDGLVTALGGRDVATTRLDEFMTTLNSGANSPHLWAGNEPNFLVPWIYNYLGQPAKTQAAVDRIRTSLFTAEPDGAPGNDDLGAMSSWYVWAAMGIVPATPGTSLLTVSTPVFDHVMITLADNRSITIDAPGATSGKRFIEALTVDGSASDSTALQSVARDGGSVQFTLSADANQSWATDAASAPASFGEGGNGFALSTASSMIDVVTGQSAGVDVVAAAFDADVSSIDVTAAAADPGITAEADPIEISGAGVAATTRLRITASADVADGYYPLTVTATSGDLSRTQNLTVRVASEGSLARATNVIGTATSETRGKANFDDAGNSYAREELAKVGLTPGATFEVGDLHATWPSSPAGIADTVRPEGQTILVNGDATTISFVGSARDGGASATATVTFDDATTAQVPIELGDWVIPSSNGDPVFGNTIVAQMPMRYAVTEVQGAYVYATTPFTAPAGRTIASVTLPSDGDADRLRLFAIATDGKDAAPVATSLRVEQSASSVAEGDTVRVTATVAPVAEGWLVVEESGNASVRLAAPVGGVEFVGGVADVSVAPVGVGTHSYTARFVSADPESAEDSVASFEVTVSAASDGGGDPGDDDGDGSGGGSGSGDGSGDNGSGGGEPGDTGGGDQGTEASDGADPASGDLAATGLDGLLWAAIGALAAALAAAGVPMIRRGRRPQDEHSVASR